MTFFFIKVIILIFFSSGFSLQTTQKGSDSVEEYILKMKVIAHDLVAAGKHISEDELISYILVGLGSDFDSVVVTLTSRDAITLQEVQYWLQTHEMHLEQLAATSLTEFSNSEVFFAHKQSGPAFNTFRGHQLSTFQRSIWSQRQRSFFSWWPLLSLLWSK